MKTLRPYQSDAIAALYDYWKRPGSGHGIIVAPTGSGKSLILAALCKDICEKWPGTRIMILTHVRELIQQDYDELMGLWPEAPAGIFSAGLGRKEFHEQILVAGIQSIDKHVHKLSPPPEIVIIDECFIAGTKIKTPFGSIDIDKVRCGDIVYNAMGTGVVESISEKKTRELYRLELSDGKVITCTGSHPFFTKQGWVEARHLERGQNLFSIKEMRILRKVVFPLGCYKRRENTPSLQGISLGQAKMLFSILCEEIKKPNAQRRKYKKNVKFFEKNKPSTENPWWKWLFVTASNMFNFHSWFWMGNRGGCSNKRTQKRSHLSNLLQNRHCESKHENRNRNRWIIPCWEKKTIRREKNKETGIIRVENISIIKCTGNESVYNIQVSGHPSYYANGVLVHNCHLIPRMDLTRYNKAIKTLEQMYPHLRVVGLSATPYRLDSGWLHLGEGAIFDAIVYDIPVQMLIDQGHLSKLTTKSTQVKIETKGLKHVGKEFAAGDLEAAAMAGETTEYAVADMVSRGVDRKKWIVFACGLKHAAQISASLESHGVTNAIISGDMAKSERDEIIANYKGDGIFEIKCLVSVNVLTTGFNAPMIDLLAMMRPTESCGLYVQMVGRGMRTYPGKENCLILDYAGNTLRHGPIDAVDPDRKPGEGTGVAPAKECPDCHEVIHAALRVCPACGHEFPPSPPTIKHRPVEAPVLKENIEPEEHEIQKTTYKLHVKEGKKNSIKVEYQAGLSWICEWVFPESDTQWGQFYYEKFCKEAGLEYPFPKTAENFLCVCDSQVSRIWTIPDGKYTRVKKREYVQVEKPNDVIPF